MAASLSAFIDEDNIDPFSLSNSHNCMVLRSTLLIRPDSLQHRLDFVPFLTSFLRCRHRWYESTPPISPMLETLDELVLRSLHSCANSGTLPDLDVLSWLDFASLYGPSNPASAREILGFAFEGSATLIFGLCSAFEGFSRALEFQVIEDTMTIGDAHKALSLSADALHGAHQILSHCPHAAYALQPAGDLHDGPTLLPASGLLSASVRFYEVTLPALAQRLSSERSTLPLLLRVAASSALGVLYSTLDSSYFSILRSAGGTPLASPCKPRDGCIPRRDASIVSKRLLGALTTCATYSLGDILPIAAPGCEKPDFWRDCVSFFSLESDMRLLVGPARSAGWLTEAESSELVLIASLSAELAQDDRKRALDTRKVSTADTQEAVTASPYAGLNTLLELVPHASPARAGAALELSGGDLGLAMERLLRSLEESKAEEERRIVGDDGDLTSSEALPWDIREMTLRLAAESLEREEEEEEEEGEKWRNERGRKQVPSSRVASFAAKALAENSEEVLWGENFGVQVSHGHTRDSWGKSLLYSDDGEELEVDVRVAWEGGVMEGGVEEEEVVVERVGGRVRAIPFSGQKGEVPVKGKVTPRAVGPQQQIGGAIPNTARKEQNKAAVGNHNRKRGANKKRGGGML